MISTGKGGGGGELPYKRGGDACHLTLGFGVKILDFGPTLGVLGKRNFI